MDQKTYLRTVSDSLRRTIKYYQNALNKLKKSRKRIDALKFVEQRKALENSQEALRETVHRLDDLT